MRARLRQSVLMFAGALWTTALGVAIPAHAEAQGQGQGAGGTLPVCPPGQPSAQWTGCVGTWADPSNGGLLYTGEFRSGLFHGFGILQSGGIRYAGQFQNGRMHGEGIMRLESGNVFSGTMDQGTISGEGRLMGPDGREIFRGLFANGVPVQDPVGPGPGPGRGQEQAAQPGTPPPGLPAQPQPQPPQTQPVPPQTGQPAPPMQQPVRQERGYATGRVTMADGSALPPSVERVNIWISGVSSAGANVTYEPIVRPDGTYRQQLVPGAYRFLEFRGSRSGTVTVRHQGRTFDLPLELVGDQGSNSRDAADGIVQNFVWKPTGPTPSGLRDGLSVGNHTHWYGMRIAVEFRGWLADVHPTLYRSLAPTPAPTRTQVTLRLRPLTPSIDGRALRDTTLVQNLNPAILNDLPPADYELTGVATLPDGSRHTLVFQGTEADRLGYVREARVNLERDNWGGFDTRTLTYYIEGTCPIPTHPTCTPGAPAANPSGGLVAGARIEILSSGQWSPGVILFVLGQNEQGQNEWLVGYDGRGAFWNETVGADRIRLRNP
jgi:hypothetical protein